MPNSTPQKFLPCIVCGKEITEAADPFSDTSGREGFTHQPYGATTFYTYGHYGSTFFDSFNGDQLVVCICDDCLRARQDRLAYIRKVREHLTRWERFTPGKNK